MPFTVATPITCVFSASPIRKGVYRERADRAGFEFRQFVGIGARDASHAAFWVTSWREVTVR
jgi:hypothetical protein